MGRPGTQPFPPVSTSVQQSSLNFNRQIALGELGALLVVNFGAAATSHFTRSAAIISLSTVAGSKIGGTLFWLTARICDQIKGRQFRPGKLAGDIGFFTPAAIVLGLLIYDPAIFLTSHYLLNHGLPCAFAVTAGQIVAFGLFLLAMNFYRCGLLKLGMRSL